MSNPPYARWPTLTDEQIIFVAEDDLWTISTEGGTARRLTTALNTVARPIHSPDGKFVAFTGRDEGFAEVFVMPSEGGEPKRLTFTGVAPAMPLAWRDNETIIYNSGHEHAFGLLEAFEVSVHGGPSRKLAELGPVSGIALSKRGSCALARLNSDSARWKRYRGGTAGVIWVRMSGATEFRRLCSLAGNLCHPMWIDERLYFVSDHEGVANIYSCDPESFEASLTRHTSSRDYYVRWPTVHNHHIVYHAGGELYLLDTRQNNPARRIEVDLRSPRPQRQRKFVAAERNLESFDIHPKASHLAITTRGRVFSLPLWAGAVRGAQAHSGRQRLATWVNKDPAAENQDPDIAFLDDSGGEEVLCRVKPCGKLENFAELGDFGRVVEMASCPTAPRLAVTNHRYELWVLDLEAKKAELVDKSHYDRITGPSWAPDGRWLAWSCQAARARREIRLAQVHEDGRAELVAQSKPVLSDNHPSFSPCGRYLYFLSSRIFNPVYDELYFSLGFPRSTVPCLITLQSDSPSPFEPIVRGVGEPFKAVGKDEKDEKAEQDEQGEKGEKGEKGEAKPEAKPEKDEKAAKAKKAAPKPVKIDIEGFAHRVLAFPVDEGRYQQILGVARNKVYYTKAPVRGAIGDSWASSEPPSRNTLLVYDFEKQSESEVTGGISYIKVGKKGEVLGLRKGNKLRVLEVADKLPPEGGPGRESGLVDLGRIRVEVSPPLEWAQMMREAWRLQRDQFWDENMTGVDWHLVLERYRPLLDRISTRAEFSDLMWEMQGELGTSHAYEMGGDRREGPRYPQGVLGADLRWQDGAWRIARIYRGDSWNPDSASPLAQPGIKASEGDAILAVNGVAIDELNSPEARLVNLGGQRVELSLSKKADGSEPWSIIVKTLIDDTALRYRDWVESNRAAVHQKSDGKIGYVHIPDMGPEGYAEFFRGFLSETEREGLIIDARFNRGGHVSQLLLEKLARKRLGYDASRHGRAEPYPAYSFDGPMIALTNEHAGSDGDIFCHSFKLLGLGKLIGKRTWGGVIGIYPRHFLADGTVTTQPEFSFWFKDVGYGVENYGTEPDIDIDWAPLVTEDIQLQRAIDEANAALKQNPVPYPDLNRRPNLSLPKLDW